MGSPLANGAAQVSAAFVDTGFTMPKYFAPTVLPTVAADGVDQTSLWLHLQFEEVLTALDDASVSLQQAQVLQAHHDVLRASSLIRALQNALDMARGGELAHNLFELFEYLQRRLGVSLEHGAVPEQARALKEVHGLLSQVMDAWQCEPTLVPTREAKAPALLH